MTLRIGSLCSGYGGLDLAVSAVLDAEPAWFAQYDPDDKHQYAARVLAHRFRDVPNCGDITAIDYSQVEVVDIVTAGFPCQDVSLAGKRAGMREGTRSGLWSHVARTISELRPPLVLVENVRSLTSAWADSDLEFCPWCVGDAGDEHSLRALGCVLGDLADLGFDAEWTTLRASDVGAPHKRERVFVLAWPAVGSSDVAVLGACRRDEAPVAHSHNIGRERDWAEWERGRGLEDHRLAAANAERDGLQRQQRDNRTQQEWEAPNAVGRGLARDSENASHAQGDGRHEGRAEPARIVGGPDAALGCGAPVANAGCDPRSQDDALRPAAARNRRTAADADGDAVREQPVSESGCGDQAVAGIARVEWGAYRSAIRRWEHVLGRLAPRPVDDRGRLSSRFVEWMQGLPDGWVTGVPDIPRTAQLKALGNGVVPQQGAAALRVLLAHAGIWAVERAEPSERAA